MGDKIKEIRDYFNFWPFMGWEWRIRNFVNIVDDPIDNIKHMVHGMSVFGLVIYLPKWLMPGSGEDNK